MGRDAVAFDANEYLHEPKLSTGPDPIGAGLLHANHAISETVISVHLIALPTICKQKRVSRDS